MLTTKRANTSNLNLLLNLFLKIFYPNTRCLHIMTDYNQTDLAISNLPIVFERKNIDELSLDSGKYCRDFLLYYKDAAKAINNFEQIIKAESGYNERRYILILNNKADMKPLFELYALNFLCEILVIVPTDNKIELYTTKFIRHDARSIITEPILVDT